MNNVNTLSYLNDEALISECRKRDFQIQKKREEKPKGLHGLIAMYIPMNEEELSLWIDKLNNQPYQEVCQAVYQLFLEKGVMEEKYSCIPEVWNKGLMGDFDITLQRS